MPDRLVPAIAALVLVALPSTALAADDECENAVRIFDGQVPFSTAGASTSSAIPCGPGGRDIWFRCRAAGTVISIFSCGSNFDTVLQAFSGDCGNLVSLACNDDACQLQSSISFGTIPGEEYFVRIGGFQNAFGSGVLTVQGTAPPEIGVNYCDARVNSTAVAAEFRASGSRSVQSNDLVLEGLYLPLQSFAFFLTSQTEAFVPQPPGSVGNLCLGGSIGRYVGPGQVQSSGATGSISLPVDLNMHPQPTGFVAVVVGESWSFQFWYRDTSITGVPISNFSNGYRITFES